MTSRTFYLAAAAFALAVCPAFSQPPVPAGAGAVPGPGGRGQAGLGGPSIKSPEILADNRVTFRVGAPRAAEVTLTGEWTDTGTPLTKDDKGIWSLTVGPLKPDLYCYSFVPADRDAVQKRDEVQSPRTPVMKPLGRITRDADVMSGKPCIRGMRVTVGTVFGMLAAGRSPEEILKTYPCLEEDDIREALACAAWGAQRQHTPLV